MIWLILALLCLLTKPAHPQVYANQQNNGVTGLCLLCGVTDPDNAVNSNTGDYSTFNITVGLLGITVYQTLIFPAVSNSGCDSLVIGIGSNDALLSANLFGGVTVQTFNGNTANNDARVVDSSVLRLLQNNTRAEIVLHPTQSFDRVRITLTSSLLGLLSSFRVYYAYRNSGKPTNPVYTVPQGITCGSQVLTIQNYVPGNYYRVRIKYKYGGAPTTPVSDTSFTVYNSNVIVTPDISFIFMPPQADIYVQAVNPFTNCSSDSVHRSYSIGATPSYVDTDADSITICKGDSATLHAYNSAFPPTVILWYDTAVGGTLLHTGNYFKVSPSSTTTYYVTGSAPCENPKRRPVKVFVKQIPNPVYTIPDGFACGSQTLGVQNHQSGFNYYVRIRYVDFLNNLLMDSSYVVFNSNVISTPDIVATYYGTATVSVQAKDTVSGCRSDIITQSFIFGGSAEKPAVDADSVSICAGDSVTLHAYAPSFPAQKVMLWYDAPVGGNLLSSSDYFTVSPDTTAIYYVTTGFNCEYPQRQPVKVEVLNCLSKNRMVFVTSPAKQPMYLKIYPNPTTGEIKIDGKFDMAGAQLSIFDLQGREIQRGILTNNLIRLEGNNGLYIIKLITRTGKVYHCQILLQK